MYATNVPVWFSLGCGTGLVRHPYYFQIDNRQRRLDELGQSLYLFSGVHASPPNNVQAGIDVHVLCKRP